MYIYIYIYILQKPMQLTRLFLEVVELRLWLYKTEMME